MSAAETKAKGEDPTSAQRYATGDDLQYDDDQSEAKAGYLARLRSSWRSHTPKKIHDFRPA